MTNSGSRLAGVNKVLSRLGYSRVRQLGDSRESTIAEEQLGLAVSELQDKAWFFNRLRYTPTLTPLGWAHLPPRYELDEGENDMRWSVRGGRRLYDRDNRTLVHGTDGNLLLNEDDVDGAAWTSSNVTVTTAAAEKSVVTPGDVPNDAQQLTVDVTSGRIDQTVSGLVDGTTYAFGGYMGADGTTVRGTVTSGRLSVTGISSGRNAGVDYQFSTDDTEFATRHVGSATLTDYIPVTDNTSTSPSALGQRAQWGLAYAEFVYATADGDIRLDVLPGATLDEQYIWRPFLTPANDFTKELRVFEILDYEDLPAVVQQYADRRATSEAASILSASPRIIRMAERRENEAQQNLMRAESEFNDGSMLDNSPLVANTVGRSARYAVLESRRGRPRRSSDV